MEESFRNELLAALHIASRAPSSHNSQPWGLAHACTSKSLEALAEFLGHQIETEKHYVILALDRERELRSLPAHRIEMMLSCGMYLESLLADLHGRQYRGVPIWYNEQEHLSLPLPDWPSAWHPLAIAAIGPRSPQSQVAPADGWMQRITNRGPYQDGPIPSEVMARVQTMESHLASNGDGAEQTHLHIVQDRQMIEDVAAFIVRHASADFSCREAWAETYHFFHVQAHRIRNAVDGLPLPQLFGPLSWPRRIFYGLVLWPPSMSILKHFGFAAYLARELGDLFAPAPALALFTLDSETPSLSDQLHAGALIMGFWRRAAAEGLALHPLSVMLQHPDIRQEFQALLHVPGRICFFARLGYPTVEFPLAPRRPPQGPFIEI